MAEDILRKLNLLLGDADKKLNGFVFIDAVNIGGNAQEIHIFSAVCENGAPVKIDKKSICNHVERKNSIVKHFVFNSKSIGCLDIYQARKAAEHLAGQGKSVCANCVRELYKD